MKRISLACCSVALVMACAAGERTASTTVVVPTWNEGGSAGQPNQPEEPEMPEEPEIPEEPEEPEEPEDPGTGFETCATQIDAAKVKPLEMVILLDRSGSMSEDGKWAAATAALETFAANPESQGIGVGLGYFPDGYSNVCIPCDVCPGICFNGCCAIPTGQFCWSDKDCDNGGICDTFMCHAGGGNASCKATDYASLDVPMTQLPGGAAQLSASMKDVSPGGGTPTGPALKGAIAHAQQLAAADPAKAVVVVLATDGEPTECQPQGITEIANLAGAAAKAATPVKTFVIGVGTSVVNLNAIASAGGTGQAYLVDANAKATQSLVDTLNDIREVTVACQYEIPKVQGTLLYDLVNVTMATGGKPAKAVPAVAGPQLCAKGGWYYDDVLAPKTIVLCPTTCEAAKAATDTAIEIVYGCETVVN